MAKYKWSKKAVTQKKWGIRVSIQDTVVNYTIQVRILSMVMYHLKGSFLVIRVVESIIQKKFGLLWV